MRKIIQEKVVEYEIWTEGFRATGESGKATLMGTSKGKTFKEACINFSKTDPDFRKFFDKKGLTYWGCRLYPTHSEAAKTFG